MASRPFQITDTRRRFTFGEYLRLRLMTCGAALVAGRLCDGDQPGLCPLSRRRRYF
ncbi:MAG: hypothetical protein ACLR8P_19710 [Clostridium fessum]